MRDCPPPPPDQDYRRGCDMPVWLKMVSLVSAFICAGMGTFLAMTR